MDKQRPSWKTVGKFEVCPVCGCAVANRDLHLQWHQGLVDWMRANAIH